MKQLTTLPVEHQALIRRALQTATGKTEWDFITPLMGGMSGGSLYKVEVDDHFYVARISSVNHWGSVPKNEVSNMTKASDANVSPKVYFSDPEAGIILMEYINSQPTKELRAGDIKQVGALADLISRLHRCPKFNSGPSYLEITQGLVHRLSEQYSHHPLVSQSAKLLESLKKILNDPDDLRPSHRDMNPNNLLFNSNYYLVDWEAAAEDNLYVDLATCVNYFFYDNVNAARHFLEQYFGKALSETQHYKLHLMRIALLIYAGTNFLVLASQTEQTLLSSEECQQLPSYAVYMKLINVSKDLSEPSVQQEYGFVCFKEMLSLVNHPNYSTVME